jgi:hypothetical protein
VLRCCFQDKGGAVTDHREAMADGDPRLKAMIRALPEMTAPAGWEAEVMAAMAQPARGRVRAARWIALGVALAAGVAVALWWRHGAGSESTVTDGAIAVRVIHRGGSRTLPAGDGIDAALGDVLRVEAAGAGGELRIYRDDQELVLRCPGADGCTRGPARWIGELRLQAPGVYRAVYLAPLQENPPSGSLERDLAACGCTPRVAAPVIAR